MKLLSKWSTQLSLRGALAWRQGPKRVQDVFVLLCGEDSDDLKQFQTRLKTQLLDVNLRGDTCKEKQTQVTHSGVFEGDTVASVFDRQVGLCVERYDTRETQDASWQHCWLMHGLGFCFVSIPAIVVVVRKWC